MWVEAGLLQGSFVCPHVCRY